MADISFEKRFASLVDMQLNERLPSLSPYKIGFELLKKDDDDTHAIGVTVYKLNDVHLHVPVVFIKGQLKGLNGMYVAEHDMMVPAMDAWVASLKEKGGELFVLGEGTTNDGLGRYPEEVSLDDELFNMSGKTAGELAAGCRELASGTVQAMFAPPVRMFPGATLEGVLPYLSGDLFEKFASAVLSSPDLANALIQAKSVDGLTSLVGMMSIASDIEKIDARPDTDKVRVFSSMKEAAEAGLDGHDKDTFVKTGVLVKDTRTSPRSVLYKNIKTFDGYQTISGPGFYELLTIDGEVEPCMVLEEATDIPDYGDESILSGRCSVSSPAFFAVPLSGKPTYTEISRKDIVGRPIDDLSRYEDKKGKIGKPATQMTVNEYMVDQAKARDKGAYSRSALLTSPDMRVVRLSGAYRPGLISVSSMRYFGDLKPVVSSYSGKFAVVGDTFMIPEGSVLFFTDDAKEGKSKGFANQTLLNHIMLNRHKLKMLDVTKAGKGLNIETGGVIEVFGDKEAAARFLALDCGLAGEQVMDVLAETGRTGRTRWLYKEALTIPDTRIPARYTQGSREMSVRKNTSKAKTGQQSVSDIVAAMREGKNEVVDTAVIRGLIATADPSDIRKELQTDLIKGMDAAGRMLLLFYAHYDFFQQRYGDESMDALEEKLKQVFTSAGDLVLFLKDKASESGEQENMFGMLSAGLGRE